MRRSIQLLCVGVLCAVVSACTPEAKCAKIVCNVGSSCDPADGICKEPVGPGGGGGGGGQDGGQDAGTDAGSDGGTSDGGSDAGTDAGVPGPETCATAEAIDFDGGTTATFITNTVGARDDLNPSNTCNSKNTGDLVYSLLVTQPSSLTVTSRSAEGATVDPVIYLLTAPCSTSTALACADVDNTAPTSPEEEFTIPQLAVGTYYLVVESWGPETAGPTQVTVTLADPIAIPDTCDGAPLPSTTGEIFRMYPNAAAKDYTGTCATMATGAEVVYSFSLAQESDVEIIAGPAAFNVDPVIFVRSADCTAGVEVACQDQTFENQAERIFLRGLAAGDYFVFFQNYYADSAMTPAGPMDALVRIGPSTKPANDTCATATPLVFTGDSVTFTVDPGQASDDEDYVCSGTSSDPEVLYAFELLTPKDVSITVTPIVPDGGSGSDPTLVVYDAPCGTGTVLLCDSVEFGAKSGKLVNQPAGIYYLALEAYASVGGPTEVTVKLTDPLPNTCAAAEQIDLTPGTNGNATVSRIVSTQGAASTLDNHCRPQGTTSGGELVYEISLPVDRQFVAVVSPFDRGGTTSAAPYGYLREQASCNATDATGSLACMPIGQDLPYTVVSAPVLDAGTHYFVLDTMGATGGNYQVDFYARPIDAISAADDCQLDGGAAAVSTFSLRRDSTFASKDDFNFACKSPSAGNDNVYRFNTSTAAGGYSLRATIISEDMTNYPEPMVQIFQGSCIAGTGIEVLCLQAEPTDRGIASGITDGLKPSTEYTVLVDSATVGTGGYYNLKLDLQSFPVSNDTCGTPRTLSTTFSSSGSTVASGNDYSGAVFTGTNCTHTLDGADVVFKYTATLTGSATLRADQEGLNIGDLGYDLALAVLEAPCGTGACIATADSNGTSKAEEITFPIVQGTEYFVIVDSNQPVVSSAGRGRFNLSVKETP